MKKFLLSAIAGLMLIGGAIAAPTSGPFNLETFWSFITNSLTATPPFSSTDYFPMVRGQQTMKVPGNFIAINTSTPTTPNEPAVWSNTTGSLKDGLGVNIAHSDTQNSAIVADGAAFSAFSKPGITAQQIYEWAIGPGSTPAPGYDALRGVAVQTAGSTNITVTGAAGYTLNNQTHSGSAQDTVALFGVGVCAVNDSSCWGFDTILTDNQGQEVSTGTGRSLFNEIDCNVTSPHTTCGALLIGGTFLSQPASLTGVTVGVGSGAVWQYGFATVNGASAIALQAGAMAASGASVNSQPINFHYRNSGSADEFMELQAQPDFLVLASSEGAGHGGLSLAHGNMNVPDTGGYDINFHTAIIGSGSSFSVGSDTEFTSQNYSNASAVTNIFGLVQMASGAIIFNQLPAATVLAITCNSGSKGQRYTVPDAASPTFGGNLVGSGSTFTGVVCNGSNWTTGN